MELTKLLDIVSDVEPLGSNHWAIVHIRYNEWAQAEGVPLREDSMLKQKFDRLAHTNKSTGNPSCPPDVRRAKRIARGILAKAQAVALGVEKGSDGDSDSTVDLTTSEGVARAERGAQVGARAGKRTAGACGVSRGGRKDTEAALLECVSRVADKFEVLADAVVEDTHVRMQELVREEVVRALGPTNETIDELKRMIIDKFN
eukprot:IDg23636t1